MKSENIIHAAKLQLTSGLVVSKENPPEKREFAFCATETKARILIMVFPGTQTPISTLILDRIIK